MSDDRIQKMISEGFRTLGGQVQELRVDFEAGLKKIDARVSRVERDIYSHPPPDPSSANGVRPLSKSVAEHEDRLASMAMMLERVEKKTDDQSATWGIGVQGLRYLIRTREGRRFVLACFTALTTLVTAAGTTYAIMKGQITVSESHGPSKPPSP